MMILNCEFCGQRLSSYTSPDGRRHAWCEQEFQRTLAPERLAHGETTPEPADWRPMAFVIRDNAIRELESFEW